MGKAVMDMLPLEATMLPFPTAGSKLQHTVLMEILDTSLMFSTLVKPNTHPTSLHLHLPTSLHPHLFTTQPLHLTTVRFSWISLSCCLFLVFIETEYTF